MGTAAPSYHLLRTPPPALVVPTLDPSQQAVVDHPGGPLLVLAGPGTGKTTTLVEAVVERVRRGARPEQVLVLTFSRKAADDLRERITARLARTISAPSAWTFHSWCLALVSAYGVRGEAPRLLSGPERLVRIRELLAGHTADTGTTRWPTELRAALRTRGFAGEVADFLDRARERGLEAADLRALGRRERRDDWLAAADFFDEYVAVLGDREIDYAELVRRALLLLDDPAVLAQVRARYRCVFVDEYQDTDPAQEELLAALAGGGGDLVVVGDPDQSIYAFRGADVSCLLEFPYRFRTASGEPAPTLCLRLSRRAGPELLAASRAIAARLPAPGIAVRRLREHRALGAPAELDPGVAQARLYRTSAEEALGLADLLRRAHLQDGLAWSQMAVLVRSGVRELPPLRRALIAAGVPVAVAADELPVARDPAVAPLLLALRCAADPDRELSTEAARTLLQSPLVRASPSELRRLGRALRAADATTCAAPLGLPRSSVVLIRDAVLGRGVALPADQPAARPARRLGDLLRGAGAVLATGSAEQALWALWAGSGWPRQLAAASLAGGQAGRAADRDLDAVVALFEAVARLEQRRPRSGVAVLLAELESQEIPPQQRVEGPVGTGAVRLLTAHRAKGLEWDLVVVAHVQEGVWPDPRRRGALLDADRLSREGITPLASPATLCIDERRLFYVACTRARRRLVVTAVSCADEDGERPSRFLDDLGLAEPVAPAPVGSVLSLPELTGRLRRAAADPAAPAPLRRLAANQLARLATPLPGELAAAVPAAHPDQWWGLREDTPGAAAVRPWDEPVRLSGSAVSGYDACPLAWFLAREVHAATQASAAQGFGVVLHALARLVSTGALPADLDVLLDRLDEVWPSLGFDAPWQGERERRAAREALGRFLRWHTANPRHHAGSEVAFDVTYDGPAGAVRLTGSADRIDVDDAGRLHVVDYKTSGTKPTRAEVRRHPQLGVYQLAAREGAFASVTGNTSASGGQPAEPVAIGGAELVQLRDGVASGDPSVQAQPSLAEDACDPTWADELVARAATGVLSEQFPARPHAGCTRCDFLRCCPAQPGGQQVIR